MQGNVASIQGEFAEYDHKQWKNTTQYHSQSIFTEATV